MLKLAVTGVTRNTITKTNTHEGRTRWTQLQPRYLVGLPACAQIVYHLVTAVRETAKPAVRHRIAVTQSTTFSSSTNCILRYSFCLPG